MAYQIPNSLSETDLANRRTELDNKKNQYKFDVNQASGLGIRGILTNPEPTNSSWTGSFNTATLLSGANTLANNIFQQGVAQVRGDSIADLENLEDKLLDDPTLVNVAAYFDALQYVMAATEPAVDARQAKEYVDALLSWPNSGNTKGRDAELFDDGLFGRIPVSGPAPVTIHQVSVTELNGFAARGFPVTDDIFLDDSPFYPNDTSLAVMAAEGRLYLEDYSMLADLTGQPQSGNSEARFCYSPLALYAQPQGTNQQLYCIAIQCRENSRYQNGILVDTDTSDGLTPWDPIFVPHVPGAATYASDLAGTHADYSWMAAKAIVSQAHNCFHEAGMHLGRAHLLVEGIIMTSNRQLPSSHPLYALLKPHFEGTLRINELARDTLINNTGIVNSYMSPLIGDFRELAAKTVRDYNVSDELITQNIANRNVSGLSYYPYRDDTLQLWTAIREYTENFLSNYYSSDYIVKNDTEVQKWWDELMSPRSYGASNGLHPLVAGESYGLYDVDIINTSGAADGYYTFHVNGPRSNSVELRLNGSLVSTISYDWTTTVTDISSAYTFHFPGYLSISISAKAGSLNLFRMAESIFNGSYSVGVNVNFDMLVGLTAGSAFNNFDTRSELYDFAAWIIFTCSVQHAAFNYPQGDYFSNVALMPGTLSKPTPVPGKTSQAYWLQLLPPKNETVAQMNLMKLLSNFRYTSLAGLSTSNFSDSAVDSAVNTFKSRLQDIDTAINNRNAALAPEARYSYLLSANIPLSTNI